MKASFISLKELEEGIKSRGLHKLKMKQDKHFQEKLFKHDKEEKNH